MAKKITNKSSEKEGQTEENEKPFDYKKVNYQAIWLIVALSTILISFFATIWILSEANKYDYIGLTFKKEKFGNIPIYSAEYIGRAITGWPVNFKLVLRNDPRELSIPVENKLKFISSNTTYVTLDKESGVLECEDANIALSSLGIFMNNMKFDIKSAFTSKNASLESNRTLVNCENKKNNTVFLLTAENESRIYQYKNNSNCYILAVSNCEIMRVIEKFEITVTAEASDEDFEGYDG
ncbi:hypothetical protein HYW74_00680 [Candidatus Pacearchaeota archaeon]|nr:hypothetical protein [Candidatus Pacearchaeota archaeon]